MSAAMETSAPHSSEPGHPEQSINSPDTRSHSGSDEEPMPVTPSSAMGRHEGAPAQTDSKRSAHADDTEMADETDRVIRQSSTRATSPLSSPDDAMSGKEVEDFTEGYDEEAAQYTQPAEL